MYVGVTNDLSRRVYAHQIGKGSIFTAKYSVMNLVYFETFERAVEDKNKLKIGNEIGNYSLSNK